MVSNFITKFLLILAFIYIFSLPVQSLFIRPTTYKSHETFTVPDNHTLKNDVYELHTVAEWTKKCLVNRSNILSTRWLGTTFFNGFGLGNRLFKLASSLSLSIRLSRCFIIFAPKEDISNHQVERISYSKTIFRNIPFDTSSDQSPNLPNVSFVEENNIFSAYQDIKDMSTHGMILDGFRQNEKYFKDHRALLQQLLFPPREIFAELRKKYPSIDKGVFIHVRRGDYLQLRGVFFVLSNEYYSTVIHNLSFPEDTHFFFSCKDSAWFESQDFYLRVQNDKKTLVLDNELNTMYLMWMAERGIICSNSTFCWWGAWLSKFWGKRIVAMPSRWIYGPGADYINPENVTLFQSIDEIVES